MEHNIYITVSYLGMAALNVGYSGLFLYERAQSSIYQHAFEQSRAAMEAQMRTNKGRVDSAFVCKARAQEDIQLQRDIASFKIRRVQ